jgi:23S rRNA (cytosine1962-C5)-methyltransferase
MQALLDTIATLEAGTDARRVFHGRGGLHPGCEHWTLDFYPPVWLLTAYAPTNETELASIGAALQARWQQVAPAQALKWVYQSRHAANHESGATESTAGRAQTRVMSGSVPEPQVVMEAGTRYRVNLLQGQNHGLFLDMAEGRRWVSEHAAANSGLKVLNLFAYTCAFSVVALRAGAGHVVNVDMSAGAIATGQHNHRLNGLEAGAIFLSHDIFNSWGKLGRKGPYDLVIVDPPSYQKGSFVATKDYARMVRRLPSLLAPAGHALLCLNAPELGPDFLQGLVDQEAPALKYLHRIANPAAFADRSPARALKVLLFQAPPCSEANAAA